MENANGITSPTIYNFATDDAQVNTGVSLAAAVMGYISIANAEGASNLATLYLSTQAQADIAAAANAVVYGMY